MARLEADYFTDLLCVWAYVAQARMDELAEEFGEAVHVEHRFCSVFGDTPRKIDAAWKDKGGYAGFNAHLRHVAERYPHIEIHPAVWIDVRPASSASAHLFLSAVRLAYPGGDQFDRALLALRDGFFRHARDISDAAVQREIAAPLGLDLGAVDTRIDDGSAFAALMGDYQAADRLRIEGSPTLVLNEGRQKLFGNVGYRIIQANVHELLRRHGPDEASWC